MATKEFKQMPTDLQRLTTSLKNYIEQRALPALGAETITFAHENFQRQGFQGSGFQKWQPRKTTDRRGRNLTRYRRGKRTGQLTKFGHENKDRALLVKSGQMRHSLRWNMLGQGRIGIISTDYAPAQNFGKPDRGLPQRQFIGASPLLARRIEQKLRQGILEILRQRR